MLLNCHKLSGEFTKKIIVSTNDPKHPNETLTCKGKILEAVKVNPAQVNFGPVGRGIEDFTRKVDLKRGDGGPLKLELPTTPMDNFQVKIHEITPGEHYELEVTLVPPITVERAQSKLEITTGVPESPVLTIPLYASVPPRVTADPRHIVVPPRDADWEQPVELVWGDATTHKILDAKVSDSGIQARIEDHDGKQRVVVHVPAGYQSANPAQRLTITTDDTQSPTVQVPISLRRSGVGPSPLTPGAEQLKSSSRIATTPKTRPRLKPATTTAPATAPTTAPAPATAPETTPGTAPGDSH